MIGTSRACGILVRPPVAQWIRATDFGSVGRGFESLRAGHTSTHETGPPGDPEGLVYRADTPVHTPISFPPRG